MKRTASLIVTTCSLALLAVTQVASAASHSKTKFPRGCRAAGYDYQYGYLVLTPALEKQTRTLYFIKNLSSKNVQLKTIKDPNDLFTPEYDKLIPRHKWGAFAMDNKELHFQCVQVKNKHQQQEIRCDNLFAICEYDNAKFPHASMGTYWIERSGTLQQTIRASIRSGILLRW